MPVPDPRTVHHVDDYGADPAGEEAADEALDAAIDAADHGDWVSLSGGTYYLAKRHTIRKELVVCATGGVIESDCHPGHGYDDPHSRGPDVDGTQTESLYPILEFRGERGERVALADAVREDDDRVSVADSAPFAVGDGILLCNEDLDVPDRVGAVGGRTRSYEPTVSTIREIDGDDLFLDVAARYDHDVDGHHVYPLSFLDRTGFVDCHFRNRHEPYWDETLKKVMGGFRHAMSHAYCRRPVVRDCSVVGYDTKMWTPIDVLEGVAINPRAEAPLNVNGSHGEPLYILGGTNVTIHDPVIRGARRAIDARAGCKTITVTNPDVTGTSLVGLSYHHGHEEYVRGNLDVYGGRVHCKPTDPTQDDHGGEADRRHEYQRGEGVRGTPANGRVRVFGTSFVARDRGASLYGSGAVIDGCEFSTVRAGTGTGESVLAISGEDVTIRNAVVRANPHGADHRSAVRVDGATNVDLDVAVRGEFAGTPIVVDGGERLRLRVRASASSAVDDAPVVRIGGDVRDLELCGDAYADGPGVAIAPDASLEHVRLREFTHRGEGPTLRIDGDPTIRTLRLDGVTSLHDGDLEFDGTLVDGLSVRNCAVGRVRGLHPAQLDDEGTVLEGNWKREDSELG